MSDLRLRRSIVVGLALALVLPPVAGAGVKVRSHKDDAFDFRTLNTWSWHPKGAGEVKMAVTANDDPAPIKATWDPVIKDAVEKALAGRQLQPNAASPQLHVTYYLLITTNTTAQTLGQFAPNVPEWGLPPFTGATQSLRVFEQGSLVLDVSSTKTGNLVWRGIAEAEINRDKSPEEREARVRGAIADLVKKFPKN
jgi:Domain of unknown function (DUF4136)